MSFDPLSGRDGAAVRESILQRDGAGDFAWRCADQCWRVFVADEAGTVAAWRCAERFYQVENKDPFGVGNWRCWMMGFPGCEKNRRAASTQYKLVDFDLVGLIEIKALATSAVVKSACLTI